MDEEEGMGRDVGGLSNHMRGGIDFRDCECREKVTVNAPNKEENKQTGGGNELISR